MFAEARLRDGTEALIWELLPSDREALRQGYEQLSDLARHHRFLSAVPHLTAAGAYLGKLAIAGVLLAAFETAIAKMRVFRVPAFLGAAFMMGILGVLLLFVSRGGLT